jgi:signal transduction histidine kinase
MEKLTNDLLSLVSLEDERGFRPDMEETNLEQILQEAASSVESLAREKKIPLRLSCPPDLSVKLYPALMVQVWDLPSCAT